MRWEAQKPGLDAKRWSVGDVAANVVRVDPKRWSLDVALADANEGGAALSTVESMAIGVGAEAAVNGGFFDTAGRPLGLRVSGGKTLHDVRRADWGVFFVRAGVPGQVHTRDAEQSKGAEFAIQCGPRLVQDGRPMDLKEGLHRRTAIGSDARGHVYLLVTLGAIDLNVLASALAKRPNEGGMGLRHALNLDGGPSTQMFARSGRWNVAGASGVADAVVALERR